MEELKKDYLGNRVYSGIKVTLPIELYNDLIDMKEGIESKEYFYLNGYTYIMSESNAVKKLEETTKDLLRKLDEFAEAIGNNRDLIEYYEKPFYIRWFAKKP